ncbi:MAG TPA: hypothetical protein VD864_13325, partial [Nocardioides sp.]|nr:hypothetical protein [Nocardioides sp.]
MSAGEDRPTAPTPGRWDHLVGELRALRLAAGEPSYAEIARRIAAQRRAQGVGEHAAHVARSTVHDAFRPDRSRINLTLVREIVAALGADPGVVDDWLRPAPASEAAVEPAPLRHVLLLMVGCVALNLAGRVVVDVLHLPVYLDMVGTAI